MGPFFIIPPLQGGGDIPAGQATSRKAFGSFSSPFLPFSVLGRHDRAGLGWTGQSLGFVWMQRRELAGKSTHNRNNKPAFGHLGDRRMALSFCFPCLFYFMARLVRFNPPFFFLFTTRRWKDAMSHVSWGLSRIGDTRTDRHVYIQGVRFTTLGGWSGKGGGWFTAQ